MKVYCKNCKWFYLIKHTQTSSTWRTKDYYCDPNKERGIYHWFIGLIEWNLHDLIKCKQHNNTNDCTYYKRKWYKFWIKGDSR